MTEQSFKLARLPGMNDLIGALNAHRYVYSKLKKQWTNYVALSVKHLRPIDGPAWIEMRWTEPNRRRDPDNVTGGGTKLVLDGLVLAGILKNDGWKWVKVITNVFEEPNKRSAGVVVILREGEIRPGGTE